jgi:hypothetical protein
MQTREVNRRYIHRREGSRRCIHTTEVNRRYIHRREGSRRCIHTTEVNRRYIHTREVNKPLLFPTPGLQKSCNAVGADIQNLEGEEPSAASNPTCIYSRSDASRSTNPRSHPAFVHSATKPKRRLICTIPGPAPAPSRISHHCSASRPESEYEGGHGQRL